MARDRMTSEPLPRRWLTVQLCCYVIMAVIALAAVPSALGAVRAGTVELPSGPPTPFIATPAGD